MVLKHLRATAVEQDTTVTDLVLTAVIEKWGAPEGYQGTGVVRKPTTKKMAKAIAERRGRKKKKRNDSAAAA